MKSVSEPRQEPPTSPTRRTPASSPTHRTTTSPTRRTAGYGAEPQAPIQESEDEQDTSKQIEEKKPAKGSVALVNKKIGYDAQERSIMDQLKMVQAKKEQWLKTQVAKDANFKENDQSKGHGKGYTHGKGQGSSGQRQPESGFDVSRSNPTTEDSRCPDRRGHEPHAKVEPAKKVKKKAAEQGSEIPDPKDPTWLEIRQRTSGRPRAVEPLEKQLTNLAAEKLRRDLQGAKPRRLRHSAPPKSEGIPGSRLGKITEGVESDTVSSLAAQKATTSPLPHVRDEDCLPGEPVLIRYS
ncbi:unnamed protein product [Durusdinium trenchii]|uniref:Uncharacterized protein n=1 Tax=Durusdinium trenchii TaxID=1381693 RepID=A0ABP0SSL3_9DINO